MIEIPANATVRVEATVNGTSRSAEVAPRTLLSDFLREHLGLVGTNVGCEHGYCGACTVIMDGRTVRSCLTLAACASGSDIRTVEGLTIDGELGPLQQAFRAAHGLQCGFCTPGMLMTVTELLENTDGALDEGMIRGVIAGNICRCTGYVHIVDAVIAAAQARDA
jgi:carbon-monoxide dehydrogenase small subunit